MTALAWALCGIITIMGAEAARRAHRDVMSEGEDVDQYLFCRDPGCPWLAEGPAFDWCAYHGDEVQTVIRNAGRRSARIRAPRNIEFRA